MLEGGHFSLDAGRGRTASGTGRNWGCKQDHRGGMRRREQNLRWENFPAQRFKEINDQWSFTKLAHFKHGDSPERLRVLNKTIVRETTGRNYSMKYHRPSQDEKAIKS